MLWESRLMSCFSFKYSKLHGQSVNHLEFKFISLFKVTTTRFITPNGSPAISGLKVDDNADNKGGQVPSKSAPIILNSLWTINITHR